MTLFRRHPLATVAAHAVAGALFGLSFPLAVWVASLTGHGLPLSLAGAVALHRLDPSLGILDLVPLALCAMFVFIGWRQVRIAAQHGELQEKVAQLLQANLGLAAEGAERRQAEDALRESETRFRTVVESLGEGILITDLDGGVVYMNPRLTQMTGYTAEDLLGRSAHETLLPPDDWPRQDRRSRQRGGGTPGRYECRLLCKDGTEFWAEAFGAPYCNAQGEVIGTLGALTDITERKNYERQLTHQAFHDALTGLPNRALFQERLERALARAAGQGRAVAVIFLDLDNFKVINDSLGHQAGDRLLVAVAERLTGCVGAEDTVARLGGDEFTVLLEDLLPGEEAADAAEVAERIMARLRKPVRLGDHEAAAVPSLGIVLSVTARDAPADLMRDADTAMYQAKAAGKAGIVFFDSTMNERAMERLSLEDDLRHALERGQMRLHFQPIVALDGAPGSGGSAQGGGGSAQHVCEAEALVRWQHPERGLLSPDRFIPLAEETGLIVPLGLWVLEEACRQAALWWAQSPGDAPVVVAVNLSARQLQQPGLVADVLRVLAETGLPPCFLKLEITETAMMQDADATIARLAALKARGVRLAVDDFGTGYSSMTYLRQFPVDTLKIDRSFISRLAPQTEDAAIVQAIVTLAKTLNLRVTAEGIETVEQVAHLQALGCDWGQGYFFARPLQAEVMAALMSARSDPPRLLQAA